MLQGRVVESVAVELVDGEPNVVADDSGDLFGHGTACGGIILGLAPEVELVSVRVLGADLKGKGAAFLAGLEWATERGVTLANLSLSSKSEPLFPFFHEVVDEAYFRERPPGQRGQQRARPELPVAVLVGLLGRGPRHPGPVAHLLQPAAAGRVRAPGASTCPSPGRTAADRGDRQQLRGAAHRRPRGAHPVGAPRPDAVRGQGDPGGLATMPRRDVMGDSPTSDGNRRRVGSQRHPDEANRRRRRLTPALTTAGLGDGGPSRRPPTIPKAIPSGAGARAPGARCLGRP